MMNRTVGWTCAALLVLSAAAMPAAAAQKIYAAPLSGDAESPPNASGGGGAAVVTFDLGASTMRVQAGFAGLAGDVTAAHIHCCTAVEGTGTAGVATMTPIFAGFPQGVNFGFYDHTFDMTDAASYNAAFITANGGSVNSAFDVLLAGLDAGKAYFNIHSTFAPGGEIRGFLQPVPEPETYALMLAGLGVVGWAAARRRKVGV
jgi:hypothetical protein